MKAFARLFQLIDQTNSTNEKVHLMQKYFASATPENSAWALYLLTGRRPKRLVGSARMRIWLHEMSGLPEWLIEECYAAVGDTAEMIALIMSAQTAAHTTKNLDNTELAATSLADWMTKLIMPLADLDEAQQKQIVTGWWQSLPPTEIFIVNKFMTGALRVGVSETLVYRALEKHFQLPRSVIAARLLGSWQPTAEFFTRLALPAQTDVTADESREVLPRPFCLAAPLEVKPQDLGSIDDWLIEWKWDGIRSQIVKFGAQIEIWSRGEERITDSFRDLADILKNIPGDWIMDGEIVAGEWFKPALFQDLQKRLNRKKPSAKFQKENPVAFIAYDFLLEGAHDLTHLPLVERLSRLEAKFSTMPKSPHYGISPKIAVSDWSELEAIKLQSRAKSAEGLMIKLKTSRYETGRKRGIWFKFKVDPLTVDAVLTTAQPGTGRRASLYTDYTFSIWKENKLVPIAKAYSGLSDAEIRDLDKWIRGHTLERFGPVRAVAPERVYEIGFEGIAESSRHRSGFAVRFPRILRERIDKTPASADHVEDMAKLFRTLRGGPDSVSAI